MARTWMVLALLWARAAMAHDDRADKCGCHNQYGLRHCHPSKKTSKCEAPAKGERERKDEPRASGRGRLDQNAGSAGRNRLEQTP